MNEYTRNYRITLQYEGSRYDGWQKQGNTENTIQGRLEHILGRMTGEPVEVHGSGRTDAGVHAFGQVANFHLKGNREEKEVMEYLNRYLPDDIAVVACDIVSDRFHSRLNAVQKTYLYQIEMGPKRDVFSRRMQYALGQHLDIDAMKKAAEQLCGTHDYKSFCGNKKMKKSTVRTVYSIAIEQSKGSSLLTLRYTGNGFLQHMVRIMTGTLIEVGQGKRSPESMADVLRAQDRQTAGFTAPAEGLCLAEVWYEP
ncbi:MAG: tRNA pseudouridine(38-40) synthase TruA [Brotaphodocola sp.]